MLRRNFENFFGKLFWKTFFEKTFFENFFRKLFDVEENLLFKDQCQSNKLIEFNWIKTLNLNDFKKGTVLQSSIFIF
jgi:hypothetical protein